MKIFRNSVSVLKCRQIFGNGGGSQNTAAFTIAIGTFYKLTHIHTQLPLCRGKEVCALDVCSCQRCAVLDETRSDI